VPYLPLGSALPLPATLDNTGFNPGNFTNAFTSDKINIRIANFECYHMVVTNAPFGGAATVQIGTRPYSFTQPFGGSEWDPQQPMLLNPGQDVYFLWNVAVAGFTGPPPLVTMYFRYDPALPGNSPLLIGAP